MLPSVDTGMLDCVMSNPEESRENVQFRPMGCGRSMVQLVGHKSLKGLGKCGLQDDVSC